MEEFELTRLEIQLEFERFVFSSDLQRIISISQEAIYDLEKRDLYLVRNQFQDIPDIVFNAAAARLHDYSGNLLLFNSASKGSIILGGAAAGLAVWFLNQTLGESVKEAWLESESHEKVKEFLLQRFGGKRKATAQLLSEKFEQAGYESTFEELDNKVVVRLKIESSKAHETIPSVSTKANAS